MAHLSGGLHGISTLLLLIAVAGCASPASMGRGAVTKEVSDIKELAGTWRGWVAAELPSQVTIMIREDGSYEGASRSGSRTVGRFFLDSGKVRYQSSRSAGAATLFDDNGRLFLIVVPDGTDAMGLTRSGTGRTELERVSR